ncbi:type II secretory pathway pseudopilin PulG [Thioalkalivibrio sulfidiphilus HL-EbGr7]|uniref:Type II secretory pathway pseudopilin PulG n=1 Tax=Thioalkalivibrio sulfidiphilus (strain HL-EbGR7) TaxID=396588 RepID=B8GR79_THISH|nr:type II secretory pathway pseudopilin PulG [Thioalkalivibrio sulfidiphilus HL-EbGr7]
MTRGKREAGLSFALPNSPFPLQSGFTLIEMIMVIVLLGALVAVSSVFIVQPFRAFDDMKRRAELVEAADSALMLMTRELRAALPNSVRVQSAGGRTVLEFIPTLSGGRYRATLAGDGSGDILDFGSTDTGFDVMGPLPSAPGPGSAVVIYNLTAVGGQGNAYASDNRAPVDAAGSSSTYIALAAAHRFPFASPAQRFQLVSSPVSYVCDPVAGVLTRHQGYGFQSSQPVSSTELGAGDTAARFVAGCDIRFDPGAGTRNGLVSIRLSLSEAGETVSLLQQVHVLNTP